jgi:Mor family transcriptional regulator
MDERPDNELLELLHVEVEALASAAGLPSHTARDLARRLCERVMHRAGGDRLYIPSGRDIRRQEALAALRAGASRAEVCRRYGVTRRTLQRWLRQGRVSDARTPVRPLPYRWPDAEAG